MKTKTKMIDLVEIAIVLCSVFLVATLPAIAAQDQNQGMQKISVSAITTASEDDFVLGIYGNANEDDTIDMGP
jgi:CO dehydrogenase/acetyl-CoA synthase epsilon subunit